MTYSYLDVITEPQVVTRAQLVGSVQTLIFTYGLVNYATVPNPTVYLCFFFLNHSGYAVESDYRMLEITKFTELDYVIRTQ